MQTKPAKAPAPRKPRATPKSVNTVHKTASKSVNAVQNGNGVFDIIQDQNMNIQNPPEPDDVVFIKETLRGIMRDPEAPAAAKAQAARTLAEMLQALGKHQAPQTNPDRQVQDMTQAELEAELGRLTE